MNFPILKYVRLDENLVEKINDLYSAHSRKIDKLAAAYFKERIRKASKQDALTKLAIALKAAEKTFKLYQKLGVGEDVFAATLDDIRIWCENCGNIGLDNIGWIKNHIAGKLFKIGRLQYQAFSHGKKLIYIHIPQGEKLDFDACKDSVRMANEFFRKYFPKYVYKHYFCESWLLYQPNKNFMNPDSNIVKFSTLFDLHKSIADEEQAFERIFSADRSSHPALFDKDISKRIAAVRTLPEQTSLQKAAKSYLLDGNKLGVGIATIDKDKFDNMF